MQNRLNILPAANSNRAAVVALLQSEKLPVVDLPVSLDYFFIAVDDKTVVGAAGIELYESYGLLRSLVVHAGYRNHGIAEKLAAAVESSATQLHLKSIYLLTETARGYFERKGYAVITREDVPESVRQSSEFSHVCPASAVVMQKQIS